MFEDRTAGKREISFPEVFRRSFVQSDSCLGMDVESGTSKEALAAKGVGRGTMMKRGFGNRALSFFGTMAS